MPYDDYIEHQTDAEQYKDLEKFRFTCTFDQTIQGEDEAILVDSEVETKLPLRYKDVDEEVLSTHRFSEPNDNVITRQQPLVCSNTQGQKQEDERAENRTTAQSIRCIPRAAFEKSLSHQTS